jgi:hypothetical protein
MTALPVKLQTPKLGLVQIVNADSTNWKTVYTAAAAAKLVSVGACSDDSSSRVIQVSILRSATNYIIGAVSVPTLAGTDGSTAAVDLIGSLSPQLPLDTDGQHYLLLHSGDVVQVKATASVTSGKIVHVTATAAEF